MFEVLVGAYVGTVPSLLGIFEASLQVKGGELRRPELAPPDGSW